MARLRLRRPPDETVIEVALEPSSGPDVYKARLGDEVCEAELVAVGASGGRLRIDGRVAPFHVHVAGVTIQVWIDGETHVFESEPAERSGRAAAPAAASGDVKAPMPGTILKLHARVGERVAIHQPLVVMESMKMEMTLAAQVAGTVTAVQCAEGQLVDMGAMLVKIEEAADAGPS